MLKKNREDYLTDCLLAFAAGFLFCLLLMAQGCTSAPTHNAAGGYIPACGDLPGLVGDDC